MFGTNGLRKIGKAIEDARDILAGEKLTSEKFAEIQVARLILEEDKSKSKAKTEVQELLSTAIEKTKK